MSSQKLELNLMTEDMQKGVSLSLGLTLKWNIEIGNTTKQKLKVGYQYLSWAINCVQPKYGWTIKEVCIKVKNRA